MGRGGDLVARLAADTRHIHGTRTCRREIFANPPQSQSGDWQRARRARLFITKLPCLYNLDYTTKLQSRSRVVPILRFFPLHFFHFFSSTSHNFSSLVNTNTCQ